MGRSDRTYWTHPLINQPGGVPRNVMCAPVPRRFPGPTGAPEKADAPLVSSLLENGRHSPVLDLDYDVTLLPSSTKGNYHLYLDGLELPWWKYRILMFVMAWAGMIQVGYYKWSVHRGMSTLRRPGIRKPRFEWSSAAAEAAMADVETVPWWTRFDPRGRSPLDVVVREKKREWANDSGSF